MNRAPGRSDSYVPRMRDGERLATLTLMLRKIAALTCALLALAATARPTMPPVQLGESRPLETALGDRTLPTAA